MLLLSMIFSWALNTGLVFDTAHQVEGVILSHTEGIAFSLSFFIIFLICIWRNAPWPHNNKSYVIAMGVLLAFSFVFLFSFAFSLAESAPLSVVTGATVGISRALGYVLWQQVFSLQPHKPMAIEVVLGSSLAGGAFFFVTWFPPAGVCVLSLVLAIINCTGLFALFSLIPDVPRTTSAVQPATGAIATCVRGNWAPVLVMSLLGFLWGVFAILATQYNPGGFLSSLYAIGRLAAALLIFIYLARVSFKIDLNVLFKLLVPLCITTVLLYPLLGEETSTCIATVYYAVFGIASIAMIIACAAMSHTFKLHPSTVYCLFFWVYLSVFEDRALFGSHFYRNRVHDG